MKLRKSKKYDFMSHLAKYAFTFSITCISVFVLLVLSALIPRESVKQKILESAEYMGQASYTHSARR